MVAFVSGAVAMGSLVIAMFFWRSWLKTHDRLFSWFAVSFSLMALERFLIDANHVDERSTPWIYLIRLAAFALIAIAIVDKNRR